MAQGCWCSLPIDSPTIVLKFGKVKEKDHNSGIEDLLCMKKVPHSVPGFFMSGWESLMWILENSQLANQASQTSGSIHVLVQLIRQFHMFKWAKLLSSESSLLNMLCLHAVISQEQRRCGIEYYTWVYAHVSETGSVNSSGPGWPCLTTRRNRINYAKLRNCTNVLHLQHLYKPPNLDCLDTDSFCQRRIYTAMLKT